MIVGIAGLGLIGGSLAKAYKSDTGHTVYGYDKDDATLGIAQVAGAVDGILDEASIGLCDVLLIALYPRDSVTYLRSMAPSISKNTLVIDCCGVKRAVCDDCLTIARDYDFTFVGGHPMAGTHNSGFKHSRAALFKGAVMLLVPPVTDDIQLYDRIEKALSPVGFGHLTVTTAEKHDAMIAFTSQLPHIVSSAFIKSPTAGEHKGYSAGSYKDLTRVAWMNPDMWADLFLENRDDLLHELDIFAASLSLYRQALEQRDGATLRDLLDEGRRIKEELDGR
jgi:prephenate dehydrogenase